MLLFQDRAAMDRYLYSLSDAKLWKLYWDACLWKKVKFMPTKEHYEKYAGGPLDKALVIEDMILTRWDSN